MMGHGHSNLFSLGARERVLQISATGKDLILMDHLAQNTDMKERVSLSPDDDSSQNASSCRHFSAVISKVLQDHDFA